MLGKKRWPNYVVLLYGEKQASDATSQKNYNRR
jgi:hypothetical protein